MPFVTVCGPRWVGATSLVGVPQSMESVTTTFRKIHAMGIPSLPLNRNNSLKLFASDRAHTRTGSEYNAIGIIWQYRFGGGL